MLYGSETWPVKEKSVIRLERNGAGMVRWMCNFRTEAKITAEELRTRVKLNRRRNVYRIEDWNGLSM